MKHITFTTIKTTLQQALSPATFGLDLWIEFILLLAIGVAPLLFSPLSSELFEFPKMVFIYTLAIVGLLIICLKTFRDKKVIAFNTPINTPLLLFLVALITSTALSIDLYTSIMGYYSRFNGGLASLAAYLVLFYLTLVHLSANQPQSSANKESKHQPSNSNKIQRIVWTWLLSSFIVSLWGIFEHFGYDYSCLLLTGNIQATCWVQDVQARVFASFGQPNWLAAYLLSSLPIAFYVLISSNSRKVQTFAWLIALSNYAAFWYTYSRSGWIGLVITLLFLLPFLKHPHIKKQSPWLLSLIAACTIISLTSLSMATQRTATSLDSGEFDSSTGQIRLLVWQGSLETIGHYPIFGSGPETFAYSFLPHRPAELNATTEWNFLYNKAHNDVLHIAATLGSVGLILWLGLYAKLGYITWRQFRSSQPNYLHISLYAGTIGIFVAQLFGFSVVITSLLFWISAAIIVSSTSRPHFRLLSAHASTAFLTVGLTLAILLTVGLFRYTAAEVSATQANDSSGLSALNTLKLEQAIKLNPLEPKYHAQQAKNYAQLAQWSPEPDPYIASSLQHIQIAHQLNPHNIINAKSLIGTYRILTKADDQYYDQAIAFALQAQKLDSHDVVIHQYLAELYAGSNQSEMALEQYEQIITLRPHAAESYQLRAQFYKEHNQTQLALQDLEQALQLEPDNDDIITEIAEIKEDL